MSKLIIQGNAKLSGTYLPQGNKNAALPIISATLLIKGKVILNNVPEIEDVLTLIEIIKKLGVKVEKLGANRYSFDATEVPNNVPDPELSRKIRGILLLIPGLIYRAEKTQLSFFGGDPIGIRQIDTFAQAIKSLGVEIENKNGSLVFHGKKIIGNQLYLDEASVVATESAIILASMAQGVTEIFNAACEPHVADLCNFLNQCRAKITGIGSNHLKIHGTTELQPTEYSICSDHIEIGSIAVLAAVTGSELTINNVNPTTFYWINHGFAKLGVNLIFENNQLIIKKKQPMKVAESLGHQIQKFDDGPWPAFPTDLLSLMIVLATQIKGEVLFFEKMFDSRLFFTDSLRKMGAKITLCDPHRVVVEVQKKLRGKKLT
ncbi:UDP-N-acetylglucosamine 1-carboxyvinyltransferase [Candidatus Falkowbacteria bacterium]|nr:UDP-N-acetylglucosamine 1-carboxyvinyltransferase [Candidatus Falkowbacteria bacterium]